MINAIMIDSREPAWVQNLKFDGVPKSVVMLDTGDVWAVTDDGQTLMIERKTPDDFLNSLKDDRLFPQLSKLVEKRLDQMAVGEKPTHWAYLAITGSFKVGSQGQVITDKRQTGWAFAAIQGALLSIQEIGVMIVYCNGDLDFEKCILRLGKRDRTGVQHLIPPRPAQVLGPQAAILASLPGIGVERVIDILEWAGGKAGHAFAGLTDLNIDAPVGVATRRRIRNVLGLDEHEMIILYPTNGGEDV